MFTGNGGWFSCEGGVGIWRELSPGSTVTIQGNTVWAGTVRHVDYNGNSAGGSIQIGVFLTTIAKNTKITIQDNILPCALGAQRSADKNNYLTTATGQYVEQGGISIGIAGTVVMDGAIVTIKGNNVTTAPMILSDPFSDAPFRCKC